MDTSMEDDSLLSPVPRAPRRPGPRSYPFPTISNPDQSFEDEDPIMIGAYPSHADGHAEDSEVVHDGHHELVNGEEEDEEDDEDDASETSSAEFDPDADPECWARRLDELAGVMEIGEEEARALKWGPSIDAAPLGVDGVLPYEQFKDAVTHYLAATDWKYTATTGLLPSVSGRAEVDLVGNGVQKMGFESHPIRVIGNWTGEDQGDNTMRMEQDGLGLGIEGLPRAR